MYDNVPYDTNLSGMAIFISKKSNGDPIVCRGYVIVPAVYYPDWQEDAHVMHDEGSWEIDYDKMELNYSEYEELDYKGNWVEKTGRVPIVTLIHEDLSEDVDPDFEFVGNSNKAYEVAKKVLDFIVQSAGYSDIFEFVDKHLRDNDIFSAFGEVIDSLIKEFNSGNVDVNDIYKAIKDMTNIEG